MRKTEGCTNFVWPDTHTPFHHEEHVAIALAAIRVARPKRIIILGDFHDCWSISRFPKLGRRLGLKAELDVAKPIYRKIDKAAEAVGADVVFCQGNHELRLELFVAQHAPALEGLVPTAREWIPQTWKFIPYMREVRFGKMHYSHDFGRHGAQAGRQGLQDLGKNICFGHTHKLDATFVGGHVSLNCGWLGDVEQIDYAHIARARREFQPGFGLVDEDEHGNVWPQAVAIVDGACRVRGVRVTA